MDCYTQHGERASGNQVNRLGRHAPRHDRDRDGVDHHDIAGEAGNQGAGTLTPGAGGQQKKGFEAFQGSGNKLGSG